MFSLRYPYVFSYNLLQFCGHTWILANTLAQFLTFGKDAIADMFHYLGLVMTFCQLLSILELFHIADGIEKAMLLPRLVQVLQRNFLLLLLVQQEEAQSEPEVCITLLLWNLLDLLRYPHELLCVIDSPSATMMWIRYTLRIPIYALSAAAEAATVLRLLAHMDSSHLHLAAALRASLPFLVVGPLLVLCLLVKERQQRLSRWSRKMKRK